MLSLTTRQQALIDGEYKTATWLVVATDTNSNRYYWSTRDVPVDEEHGDLIKWATDWEWADDDYKWDNSGDNLDATNAFDFKIIDWPGITLRRGSAESGILAPNDLTFTITNKNSALTADDFIGGTIWVHLSIGDDDGTEIFHRWRFRVKKAVPTHQKIEFFCEDYIQEYLRADYPRTKLVDNIFPSDDQKAKDNLCVPVPFGTAYVPLRSVYITDQRYYLLGPSSYTYTITAVHSPADMPKSEWTSAAGFTFTQSTEADGDAVDWRVFQPIIQDSDNDGEADACGLFKPGDVFLDMPVKVSRSDTAGTTNPADVIKFVLQDLGIAADDINTASFTAAAATFTTRDLSFNGAIIYKRPARDVLAQLLTMCNAVLISGEQIELHVLSADSVKTITSVLKPGDVGEAIFSYNDISDETDRDSAHVAFQETGKPQDRLIKIAVPAKSSFDYPSGDVIEMPFVQDSQNVQKAACLHLQRKYLKKANISLDAKGSLLALLPDDVITISDANYGGTYTVLVEEIKIGKDLQLSISCIRFKETLDDWEDLSFSSVTLAADDTTSAWGPVIAGPDSTLTGEQIPNQLRGRVRIGQTGNHILLDPATPIIKLDEGDVDRVLIGDLGTNNHGIQINNAAGETVFKVDSSTALIGGWTLADNKISITGIELDQANERIRAYTDSNYVDLTAAGLTGYDSVLGTVFNIPTDGSAPEFSSGVIKECEYQIYTSGVVKTNTDPATNGGLLINNTDIKGYNSSGLKLLQLVYDGTDEGDAYFGDFDSGNAGMKYDHSAGTLQLRSGTADALIIESGGNIKIESGGDLVLEPDDANPAIVKWSTTYNLGAAATAADRGLCVWPTSGNSGEFAVGRKSDGTASRFNKVLIDAYDSATLKAYYSASYYALVTADANGSNAYVGLSAKETTEYQVILDGSGVFRPNTQNNLIDIGSDTYKFKSGYFGTDLTVGGNLHLTGDLNITGNIDVPDDAWIGFSASTARIYFNDLGTDIISFNDCGVTIGAHNYNDTLLHIYGGSAGNVTAAADTLLTIENDDHAFISFLTPNDKACGLKFGDADDNIEGMFYFNHTSNLFLWSVADSIEMRLSTTMLAPTSANGLNLGDATYYWGDVSYKTLTDRGCLGWFDEGVELLDGTKVTDLEALKRIQKHPVKKTVYGIPMLDYKTMPKAVYKPADINGQLLSRDQDDNPYNTQIDPETKEQTTIPAEDGAEMTALVSIMLGAIKELDNEIQRLKAA